MKKGSIMWKWSQKVAVALFALSSWMAQPAHADELFGEFQRLPDDIERGFSVGFDVGLMFLNNGGTGSESNPGFSLSFNTSYDLFEYLSLEGLYTIAIHEAAPNDPVLRGGVNTFLFNGAAKLQYPMGRLFPFVELGPGIHYSDPDYGGGKYNVNILFGGGLEYYTYLRHYSVYIKGTYAYVMDNPPDALTFSAGLRYTF